VNSDQLVEACVDLIAIHGLPMCMVEYPAFKKILDPILNAISPKRSINIRTIRDEIKKRAESERKATAEILRDKLVCLKFDFTKEILGINAQVIHENKIVVRALSMNPLLEKHTGLNASAHISAILSRYEVSLDYVYTNTTDNAPNMEKCTKLMHDQQNQEVTWYEEFHHDENCTDCLDEDWECQPVVFEMLFLF
jgi:hypothetical protein